MNKEFVKKMIMAEQLRYEAIKEILPDNIRKKVDDIEKEAFELIKEIVKDVTKVIKKNAQQPDWYKKSDTKAQIMLSVINILRRKGITEELQEILAEIIEQAEERYKEWQFFVA